MSAPTVIRVPDISTGHLTEETMQGIIMDVACGARYGATYPEGVWLWISDERDEDEPQSLLAVQDWARAEGFSWVRIDADGDRVPELPFYVW